jgi:hypothetical protein
VLEPIVRFGPPLGDRGGYDCFQQHPLAAEDVVDGLRRDSGRFGHSPEAGGAIAALRE